MSAMNQKMNECGWFYHAPAKRKESAEPVPVPMTSQIPGLNQFDPDEYNDKPKEMVFKDTDTKYIRLAKEGGRKDLLTFKEPKPKSTEAKGYPRVDWYYLEDNRVEDEQASKGKDELNWQFLLPEYMVHENYQPTGDDPGQTSVTCKKRVPFAQDNLSVFKRDDASATDKTVRIDNARPPGYGVRNSKPARKKCLPADKKAADANNSNIAHKHKDVSEKHQADMNKLLSYAYEKEWHQSHKDTKEKEKPSTRKGKKPDAKDDKTVTSRGTAQKERSNEEKELFKLSRFKNVPSKINTHQPAKETVKVSN